VRFDHAVASNANHARIAGRYSSGDYLSPREESAAFSKRGRGACVRVRRACARAIYLAYVDQRDRTSHPRQEDHSVRPWVRDTAYSREARYTRPYSTPSHIRADVPTHKRGAPLPSLFLSLSASPLLHRREPLTRLVLRASTSARRGAARSLSRPGAIVLGYRHCAELSRVGEASRSSLSAAHRIASRGESRFPSCIVVRVRVCTHIREPCLIPDRARLVCR